MTVFTCFQHGILGAVLILPSVKLPLWICLWAATIGLVKVFGILIESCRHQKLSIPHSTTNKLTGIFLFCLPFAIVRFDILIPVVIACALATFSLLEDFLSYAQADERYDTPPGPSRDRIGTALTSASNLGIEDTRCSPQEFALKNLHMKVLSDSGHFATKLTYCADNLVCALL